MPSYVNKESTVRYVCKTALSDRAVASPHEDERAMILAVVGLSDKPDRPSYGVSKAMQQMGYRIVPINPNAETVLGERCYPDLASVPAPVDVVQVFRRSEHTPEVAHAAVAEAERLGISVLWLQEGIVSNEAAAIAHAAGLEIVMDRCLYKEVVRLRQSGS